jgi:hypothetical protein
MTLTGARTSDDPGPIGVIVLLLLGLVLCGLHGLAGHQGPRWTSPLLLGDHLFDLMFGLLLFLYAAALGRKVCGAGQALSGDPLCDHLATLGLGLGMLSLGILGIGLLHLFYDWVFAAILIAGTVWLHRDLRWVLDRSISTVVGWGRVRETAAGMLPLRLTAAVLIVTLTMLWLESTLPVGSGPAMEFDALAYHLAGVKLFLHAHQIIPLPDIPLANAPSGVEMFYLLGLAAGTDGLGKSMDVLFLAYLCAATFALARRHGHPRAGWWAVIILANVLWLVPEVPTTLNDFAAAALLVLGLTDALSWLEQQKTAPSREVLSPLLLIRAGCLLGFSVSFKLSNLAVAPSAAATIGIALLLITKRPLVARLCQATLAGAGLAGASLLVLSPWLLKNLVLFGHPFYPVAVAVSNTAPGQAGQSAAATNHVLTTITSLAQVFTGSLGLPSIFLLGAPFALRSVGARAAQLFLVAGGALWIWFIPLFGEPRYYIPLIAVGAALAGAVIRTVIDRIPIPARLTELPIILFLLLHSLLQLALAGQQVINDHALRIVVGAESRYAYLASHVVPYAAEQWINEHTPTNATIAVVQTTLGYYLDRAYLNDWYGERYGRLETGGATMRTELRSWCRFGVRYALVNRGADYTGAFDKLVNPTQRWLGTPGLRPRLLFSVNYVDVYALTPCLVRAA